MDPRFRPGVPLPRPGQGSSRLTPYAGRSNDGFRIRRSFYSRNGWFVELHAFGRYIGLAR